MLTTRAPTTYPAAPAGGSAPPDTVAIAAPELVDRIRALEMSRYSDPARVTAGATEVLLAAGGDTHLAGRARLLIADAKSRTNDVHGAVETARTVLSGARAVDDPTLAARAEIVLAWSLFRMGAVGESLVHAVEGVRCLPPSAPLHLTVDHAMVLALFAGLHATDDDYIAEFDRVIADAERLDDAPTLVLVLNNYAWIHLRRGRIPEALAMTARIESLAERRGVELTCTVLDTIASVLSAAGDLPRAERVARAMLAPGVPEAEARARPEALLTLAAIRIGRADPAEAFELVRAAESVARERDLPDVLAAAAERRAGLLADLGDHRSAYEALGFAFATWREVRDRGAEDRAATLHALFETEQAHRRSIVFEQLAERDALTGLWNRRHADRVLPGLLADGGSPGAEPLRVAILDLDHFKRINDERTHLTGDAVLAAVGLLLSNLAEEPAFCARLGGEEFLLAMPGSSAEQALDLCHRAHRLVRDHPWAPVTDGLDVTVSIGLAAAAVGGEMADVLRAADEALYAAKRAGRNRVHPL